MSELPSDFDWEAYLVLNQDVSSVSMTKEFAIQHWINNGIKEGRKYKLDFPFDWKFYITHNTNLTNSYINTRLLAILHYIKYGKNNGRICHPDFISKPKYIFCHLNLKQGGAGLFNQLYGLANIIILGHYLHRQVVISGFFPNYDSFQYIPLSKVINVNALNDYIKTKKLNTYVHEHNDSFSKYQWTYSLLCDSNTCNKMPFANLICSMAADTNPYIHCITPMLLTVTIHCKENKPLFDDIISNIKFSDVIYTMVKSIKQSLNLNSYVAVHLRLEDDWIHHASHLFKMHPTKFIQHSTNQYYLHIKNFCDKQTPIFLSTGLLKHKNLNNHLPQHIQSMYPNTVFLTSHTPFTEIPQGREINAIIDYLLCLDADKFIGSQHSSFSLAVDIVFNKLHKPSKLLLC